MQYSVQQILAVKDLYREPPFQGFSLDEVCRRKKVSGHGPLKRGDNAWCVKQITDATNGVSRKVQAALNKLAPEKYEEVVRDFKVPEYLSTEALREIVVDLIFGKALIEPGYSEMYARLCYDIARFEISLPGISEADKKKSKFRDTIIRRAQKEFQSLDDINAIEGLAGDEKLDAEVRIGRRKRANIKFVGQLFIQKVMSQKVMMDIVQDILQTEATSSSSSGGGPSPSTTSNKCEIIAPSAMNIEVLTELLETTGKTLDQSAECKRALNLHFEKLRILSASNGKYAQESRTRFKLMNLVELRERDWAPRIQRADTQAPTTLQEQEAKQQQQIMQQQQQPPKQLTLGAKSPTTATPNSRGGRRFPASFPDSPSPTGGSNQQQQPQNSWRTVRAPLRETPAFTPHTPGSDPAPRSYGAEVPLEKRIKDLQNEWNGEDPLPSTWMARFKSLGDLGSDDDLARTIVAAVVREACTTTRKDAQLEACRFLLYGLAVEESLLFMGLAACLAKAIEEGLMEDSPKFNERFVTIVHSVSNKMTVEELYFDAAKLLYVVCQSLASESLELAEMLPSVEEIWNNLPLPSGSPEPRLQAYVVQPIVDLREEGQDAISAALLKCLLQRKLVDVSAIRDWEKSVSAAQAPEIVQAMGAYLAGARTE